MKAKIKKSSPDFSQRRGQRGLAVGLPKFSPTKQQKVCHG